MTGYRCWLWGHPNKPDREFYTNQYPSPADTEDYPCVDTVFLGRIRLARLKELLLHSRLDNGRKRYDDQGQG